jgi:hypothetical protein
MASIPVKVTKTGPGLALIRKSIDRLKKSEVLVGIPAPTTQRRGEPINNASLLFIQTNGSQLKNIPPRPVLEPSIEANKGIITPHLGAAAKAVMDQRPDAAERELERAGMIASNCAKRWFTDPRNNWPPNAPSTVEEKGSDRPLIDTGQLRRAITYVVREEGAAKRGPQETDNMASEEPVNPGETVEEVSEATAAGVVEEAEEVLATPLKSVL